jgi:hypothetical protein
MIFHLQFPFTDLRGFIAGTGRIPVPAWPAPINFEEFVRFFGVVYPCSSRDISESSYCAASRALRFLPGTLGRLRATPESSAPQVPLKIIFRQLHFDGYAVGKTEVGFRTIGPQVTTLVMEPLVRRLLATPTIVRSVDGSAEHRPLCEAGKLLARLYAIASSKGTTATAQIDLASNVPAETPVLFIECSAADAEAVVIPRYAHKVPLADFYDFDLFFWRIRIGALNVSVFCSLWHRPYSLHSIRLRILLLRLNADHQALKRVMKEIGTAAISPTPRSKRAQFLQQYLNIATRRIGKYEIKTSEYANELESLAYLVFDAVAPGERDSLVERLRLLDVRNNIFRKVDHYAGMRNVHIEVIGGVLDMSTGPITVIGSTNVAINSTLSNVQQIVENMPKGEAADKENLKHLFQGLMDALQKVPVDKSESAEAVATQASHLAEAAAKEKPNRTTLQLMGGALKQAAEFLKDAAPAVVVIVGQIISIIGKMHGLPL